MSNSRRLTAVLIAGFSLVLVFGALLTALAETGFTAIPAAQATNTKITVGELDPTATKAEEPTAMKKPTSSEPDATKTEKPTEVVEKSPTATKALAPTRDTDTTCTKPDGWTDYKVKSGDTLFSIATLYQTDYPTLQEGNCMGTSTQIITGQILWVPDNATLVPAKTATKTPKPTSKPPGATATPKTVTPTCYLLTLDKTGSGSIPVASPTNSSGCPSGKYTAGQIINLSASPAGGYEVGSWTGTQNNASTNTANTVKMPGSAHTATVNYVATTTPVVCYALTLGIDASSPPSSGGTPTAPASIFGCSGGEYAAGEIVTVTASPIDPYIVIDWSLPVAKGPTVVDFTMPAAVTTLNVIYGSLVP